MSLTEGRSNIYTRLVLCLKRYSFGDLVERRLLVVVAAALAVVVLWVDRHWEEALVFEVLFCIQLISGPAHLFLLEIGLLCDLWPPQLREHQGRWMEETFIANI